MYYLILFGKYAFLIWSFISIGDIVVDVYQKPVSWHNLIEDFRSLCVFGFLFFLSRYCLGHYFHNRKLNLKTERKYQD